MQSRLLLLLVTVFAGMVPSWVAIAQDEAKPNQEGGSEATPQEVDFVRDVKPILESRCLRCHGPDKAEGDFRMDTRENFFRGGLGGPPVEPGDPEVSLLYELITLGPNEEGRMPPEGQPLTQQQIAVIREWIKQGAKWPEGVELRLGPERKQDPIEEMLAGPGLEVTDEERAAIQKMQSLGALVLPIAQNTNWVRIDFSLGATHVTDSDLESLPAIRNLVELDLAGTRITDRALQYVGQCRNLVRLHLERTQVTDEGLKYLANLPYLRYLNLYGTKITDKGLEHLKGLKNLRKLYVWQTGVTPEGVKELARALPELAIITGWEVAEKSEDTEAEKPEEQQAAQKPDNQG